MILAEIKDERRWADAFAGSQDRLAALAAEAIAEHRASKIHPMDIEIPSLWIDYPVNLDTVFVGFYLLP
jgi:hypothetical protein